ncbi:hypothetical protein EJB05_49541, partial [Eragrostis curvula]
MTSDRRSDEENVKKKAKIHKSSSKESSDKVADEVRSQTSDVAAASVSSPKAAAPFSKAAVPLSKDPAVRLTSVKPAISVKPHKVFNLMSMITSSTNVCRESPSKSSTGLSKGASFSADTGKSKDKVVEVIATASGASGSKAKIQDKSADAAAIALAAPGPKAKIQDKDMGEAVFHDLKYLNFAGWLLTWELFQISLGFNFHRSLMFNHTMLEEFLPFDMTFDSAEAAEGSSLACDKVPANTFVMSAQAVEPFIATADRIRLPQVEDELMLQDGDTLYKSLLSSQVKSLAITHASLRQYRELSRVKVDRDSLRKDLGVLETKVREKEMALALSEKRLADLSSEKEALRQSAKDFELKVASLDKQVEELDASLAKVRNENEDLRGKVDAADQDLAAFARAEKLRLSGICGQVRDALVSVGSVPDQLPVDASIEYCQAWLAANIPYFVQACRAFSNNVVHLAVRDLLCSLEAGGSDALAKAISDSFSFVSTDTTPPSLVEALVKFGDHIDEAFWKRDSPDLSLSEFATPKDFFDVMPGRVVASESSSEVSLSEFAALEPPFTKWLVANPLLKFLVLLQRYIYLVIQIPYLLSKELGVLMVSDIDASEGRKKRVKRGSRGGHSRGGLSSNRGSKKKCAGCGRRSPSIDLEGTSSSFDAASHVERMVSSGHVYL